MHNNLKPLQISSSSLQTGDTIIAFTYLFPKDYLMGIYRTFLNIYYNSDNKQ